MNKQKAKILMLVEGAKTDVVLMKHLLEIYGISDSHQIVSYNTNIYVLYNRMFKDDDPETLDLLQVLKENEKDESKRKIFDERYSDILLVFDLDPHDDLFSADLFFYYYRLENDRGLAKDTFPGEEGSVKLTIRKKSIDRKDELVAGFCKMITKRYSCSVDSHVMGKRYTLEWKYSDKLINSEDALMDALKQKDNYCCLIGYDIIRDFYNLLKAKSKGDKTDDDMGARKKVGEVNDVMGNSRGYDNHFQMWEKLEKFYKAVSNNEGTIQDFFTSEGEAEFGSSDGPKPKR